MVAVTVCGGVLWWTVQVVLTDNHEAKEAIRAMGSWSASDRVRAIQDLEIAGLGNGRIAIPPLIDALRDEDARVRTAAAVASARSATTDPRPDSTETPSAPRSSPCSAP